ncbi:MAG: penicillin-binding protein activator [Herbaspirillum sp.]
MGKKMMAKPRNGLTLPTWLMLLVCGLCLSACANTSSGRHPSTTPGPQSVLVQRAAQADGRAVQRPPEHPVSRSNVQTQTTVPVAPAQPKEEIPVASAVTVPQISVAPLMLPNSNAPPGVTASIAPLISGASAPLVRIALLLPLHSSTLATAAQAVQNGVMTAYQREPSGITLEAVDSGGSTAEVLAAYRNAARDFDLIIGPLSRSAVAVVAQSGQVTRPTIALAQPPGLDQSQILPTNMLAVGLSPEDEARQVSQWIAAVQPGASVLVLSTASAWQQRAARAFVAQAGVDGLTVQTTELSSSGSYVNPSGLEQLKQRLDTNQPQVIFVALDATQTRQLRQAIGDAIPLYGTSQINPLSLTAWRSAEPVDAMNQARLVDIPWQLQADDPAVMVYPRPLPADGQASSALQERLYALGIDAYRVAREIAAGHKDFELDGVTGKLSIRFGAGTPEFARNEPQAIYRDGRVQPLLDSSPDTTSNTPILNANPR